MPSVQVCMKYLKQKKIYVFLWTMLKKNTHGNICGDFEK